MAPAGTVRIVSNLHELQVRFDKNMLLDEKLTGCEVRYALDRH